MDVTEKFYAGERLDFEDGLKLYDLDIFELGKMADSLKQARYGKKLFFNINRHINPTNICADICKFCGFSANRKNPNPYTMTHDEIMEIVKGAHERGVKEVHIVSAHNRDAGVDWYFDIFARIKSAYPDLHIKALTAAEIEFLSREYGLGIDAVIEKMVQSGVDSMPGGGAEIFDEQIREFICKGKVSSDTWLDIHRKWHKTGHMSNATMLFGHVENRAHRIDHMLRLRTLQDETGGFNAFIPLVYQRQNNYLKVREFLTGQEILKTMAISRILLDNIPHIKAYWVTSTINLALLACEFGADDLDGTIEKESINSAVGAKSANGMALKSMTDMVKNAGFITGMWSFWEI
jgi:aminodeoxyfutalosine synthase